MDERQDFLTTEEWEEKIGEHVRELRLKRNETRQSLCCRAGVSVGALSSLEDGRGSSLRTLVRIVRALGKESWLSALAPTVGVNPLALVRNSSVARRRARPKKSPDGKKQSTKPTAEGEPT